MEKNKMDDDTQANGTLYIVTKIRPKYSNKPAKYTAAEVNTNVYHEEIS